MYYLPGLTLRGFCVKIWVVQGGTKYVPRGTTRVQGGTKYVPPAWANPKWILCQNMGGAGWYKICTTWYYTR